MPAIKPQNPSRRDLLAAGASLAAGAAFLNEAVGQDANPAAQVEDRGASLRISSVEAYRVGTKAYVKILTNHKITGWGEVTGLDPNVAVALAKSLGELLIGENPTRVEHLWQKICRSHRDMRGGPFMTQGRRGPGLLKLHQEPPVKLVGRFNLGDFDELDGAVGLVD